MRKGTYRSLLTRLLLALALVGPTAVAQITVTTTNAPNENVPEEVARHQQLLEEFAELRPDVRIEARQTTFDRQTFLAKLAAGTMEDAFLVAFTEPQWLIDNGYVADVTEYLQAWQHFDSFNPEALQIVQDEQGRLYGFPVGGYALGLMYNCKMFEEAGLDPMSPPTTWEELREVAKLLSDPLRGRAGFAALSKGGQGGWHLVTMIYSFGGDLVEQRDGRWVATINTPEARAALETLKTMRWEDESLTQQQLLEVRDVLPLLATERVAMAIMAGDSLRSLKVQYEADMDRFCLGPLPQAGGDATLAGGAAWMFNPRSSPEVLQAAVEWSLFQTFEAYESDLRAQAARGQLVGWPELPIFVGEYQAIRDEIIARYANAPIENYRPFLEATHIRLKPEPPVEAQQLYRILDVVAQAILTDPFADPEQVLLRAEREFQTRVLDQLP